MTYRKASVFIDNMEYGYQSRVGERRVKRSGRQYAQLWNRQFSNALGEAV
ncbi:hypothetical protein [Pseudomonas sp. LP_7_YM]|nr:hypothetical protein [Pseudomonas sp. LP_7_YM]